MTETKYKKFFDLHTIVKDIQSYLPKFDKALFIKAFEFAEKAHLGQFRKDGTTPYLIHPVAAMQILVSLHADQDVLISALLHDVPEDTKYDLLEIKQQFGDEVAFLVDGITKLSKVHYQYNMPEREVESLKKMFLHSAKDPRVILIKLADRLHNMRTLQYVLKPEKRVRIATETMEIFVPIANLLGINLIKTELEDLSFKHLFPTEYERLREKVQGSNERHSESAKKIIETIKKALSKNKVTAELSLREKGLYRAYKRICSLGRTIDDIRDRVSIKILVSDVSKCYHMLGIIHSLFTPKTNSFEDYIANPKINGYQSLHTIVFGIGGIETEMQIQTEEMSLQSEYGIAACFFGKKCLALDEKQSSWLNNIMEIEKEKKTHGDFLEDLKIDILQDRIFVFTPKGRTVDLPKEASVIDFAYAIHSDVGNHAVKAEINGNPFPIITTLKTGDVVNVITDTSAAPEIYWLSFVKTNTAKTRILAHLRKISRQTKLDDGRKLLQKEFDIAGVGLLRDIPFKKISNALDRTFNINFETLDNLFVAIGSGEIKAVNVLKALKTIDRRFSIALENKKKQGIEVELRISAKNRFGLLKDISEVFYRHVLDLEVIHAWTSNNSENGHLKVRALVADIEDLSKIFEELEQFKEVYSIYRVSNKGTWLVYAISVLAIGAWAVHSTILQYLLGAFHQQNDLLTDVLLFSGFCVMIFTLLYLTTVINRYFPLARTKAKLWVISSIIAISALVVLFFEMEYFNFHLSIGFTAVLSAITVGYLSFSYFSMKKFK
jgi:RelA/SpoT family (p)ppGpp synthetase